MFVLGFDIGGTKCAVMTATYNKDNVKFLRKVKCATRLDISPEKMIGELIKNADAMLNGEKPDAIGVSCGGPLDSKHGVIISPPNLIGWDNVEIVKILSTHYGVPVHLQNDANACAVAEWKFGAGKNCNNMIFLTFGSGLGAGLILDGKLYSGTNDNAGEVGHIRLERFGPVGYGKAGSFEGFCSGNGIAKLGFEMALEQEQSGRYPAYFDKGMTAVDVNAKTIADAANNGDETAINVYRICGEQLGMGISILIDILNPQKIVIGSVFARSHNLLWEHTKKVIEKEALPGAAACCKVVPSELGEKIGDYAAVATALV